MDYVLFGMGYGATLMLLGWALRTFGPERKYRNIKQGDIEGEVAQRSWVRFIQGLGGVIAIVGTALVLLTFVIMLVNPSNQTGAIISVVVWGLLLVAVLVWSWLYIAQYGLTGLWSREEGYGFRSSGARTKPVSSLSSVKKSQPVTEPQVSTATADESIPAPDPAGPFVETDSEDVAVSDLEEGYDDPDFDDPLTASDTSEDSSAQIGPEYDFGDSTDTTVTADIGGRSEAIRRLRERQLRSKSTQ